MSIRDGNRVYLAPSGVQKERMKPEDLYVLDLATRQPLRSPPPSLGWKLSQCAPLFFIAYDMYGASACIHTHSQNAVMATLAFPGDVFRITHQEMIKGLRRGLAGPSHKYYDVLEVPIIDNKAEEEDLQDWMAAAMRRFPESNAVLVRRHGLYVWSNSWQKAKTMTECYDYLFEIALKMKAVGLDPAHIPEDSEYRILSLPK
ncbi:hypothetical protein HK405_005027 [Cladochytrium tenue]|nr:hypothetical protein HK405_005027 [Cladochytrium tenue]